MTLLKHWIAVSVSAALLAGCTASDWAQIADATLKGVLAGLGGSSSSSSGGSSCRTRIPVPEMPSPEPLSQWKYYDRGYFVNDVTGIKTQGKLYYAPATIRDVIDTDDSKTRMIVNKMVFDHVQQDKDGVRYDTEIRTEQFSCAQPTTHLFKIKSIYYYQGQEVSSEGRGYLFKTACVDDPIVGASMTLKLRNIACSQ